MNSAIIPRQIVGRSALLLAAVSLGFQTQPSLSPDEVRITSRPYQSKISFHSNIDLVQLEVVVRDRNGNPIDGLTKQDFVLNDGGKQRDINVFSIDRSPAMMHEPQRSASAETVSNTALAPHAVSPHAVSELPKTKAASQTRYIALFFDDVNTSSGDLAHAKIASARFVKEVTGFGDKVGIFTTSGGRILDFTSDSSAILKGFDTIQAHQRVPPGGLMACPRITSYDAYRIVNNDPSAFKAALDRACHCAGDANCEVESTPSYELMNPAARTSNSAYGGAGTMSTLISSVKAQAEQTWDLTRQVSQTTLNGISYALQQVNAQSGKRVFLLASSGFLSGSLEVPVDDIINEAIRNDVVINSIDAKGLYAESPGGSFAETESITKLTATMITEEVRSLSDRLDSVDSAPAKFAESTGGLMFKNNNDLSLGFYRLGMVSTVTYLLGFPPAEDGKYHKISVKLAHKTSGEFVQVRPGYQAPNPNSKASSSTADPLDREVSAQDTPQDFSATVRLKPAANGEHKLTLQSNIDLQKLPFQHQKDRQVEKLTFVAALYDDKGEFITGKEAEMNLALKPDSFARLSASGINTEMSLDAPKGSYRLRTVVEEGVQHKMAASNQQITIR